jgi:type II secretory pathway pseudopilin PulG
MADTRTKSLPGPDRGRPKLPSRTSSEPVFEPDSPEAGFSLIQVILAASLLTLAALSFSGVQVNSMTLAATNRETAAARNLIRQVLEQMQDVDASKVYATYNADPTDDPGGDGTAIGDAFAVNTDAGDMTVTVDFPGDGSLREDVTDEALGMPQDLNGDRVIDSEDHAYDYKLLPVRILVEWRGRSGLRTMEIHATVLRQ